MYVGTQSVMLYICNQLTNSPGTCAVDELLYGQKHQKSCKREATLLQLEKTQADLKVIHYFEKPSQYSEVYYTQRKEENSAAVRMHQNRTDHNGNVSDDSHK